MIYVTHFALQETLAPQEFSAILCSLDFAGYFAKTRTIELWRTDCQDQSPAGPAVAGRVTPSLAGRHSANTLQLRLIQLNCCFFNQPQIATEPKPLLRPDLAQNGGGWGYPPTIPFAALQS